MLLKAVHEIEVDEQKSQFNLLMGARIENTKDLKQFLKDHFGE